MRHACNDKAVAIYRHTRAIDGRRPTVLEPPERERAVGGLKDGLPPPSPSHSQPRPDLLSLSSQPATRTYICLAAFKKKPPVGFEPTTSRLLSGCSTS